MRICFSTRPYVLTGSDAELERWIEKIGARLVRLDAAEHDRLVALVSHLPQLLSTALASLIADSSRGRARGGARGSGPDAAGAAAPTISGAIFSRPTPEEIDRVIGDAIARLQTLRENLLSESDMQATFARAAAGGVAN